MKREDKRKSGEDKKIKVVVVEDSPTQAELLRYLLEGHGYSVSVAYNGVDALAFVKEQKPDIVVSDIIMPAMDGYSLCRHIKEAPEFHDVIVILLTVLSDPRDVLRGIESGADDFIIKPRHEKILFSRISQLLSMKQEKRTIEIERNVLVVEDSITQAEVLKSILQKGGFCVRIASNGRDALNLMQHERPDLVISDILMPEMNGFDLCRELKNNRSLCDIPVMLLSVLAKPEDIVKGYEAGADAYLTKPYEESVFLDKLRTIIENRGIAADDRIEPLEITYGGELYRIKTDRRKLLNFMVSIYDSAIQQNHELLNTQHDLMSLNEKLKVKFQELQASEERFETLVRTIPDIVYRISTEGRFVFLNDAIRELGYEPQELVGRHFSEIILPIQCGSVSREDVLPLYTGRKTGKKEAPKLFDERRTGDRMTIGLEVGLLAKDRRVNAAVIESLGKGVVAVEVNSSGLFTVVPKKGDRLFMGTVGVIRDITERKKQERKLKKFTESLEEKVKERTGELEAEIDSRKKAEDERTSILTQLFQSQKMEAIGKLAGGVAHDFNNLLTAIQGYTENSLMRMDESDPSFSDLNHVLAASRRAATLTTQLLLFSRRDSMKVVPLDMNKTISELLKMLRTIIGEDIEIKTEFQDSLWTINGDTGHMEQIIMNLAVNARDAMPDGGELFIRTENLELDKEGCSRVPGMLPGRYVRITMSDTGTGMEAEIIQHIFDPFFTTKDISKGSGLGLSIVYGIVKEHNGCVTVDSSVGRGSKFRIYLPAASGDIRPEYKDDAQTEVPEGSGERILIVEDEEYVRGFARSVLSDHGYEAVMAADAEEALKIFEKEGGEFALVFSDVILPGESGISLVDKLVGIKHDVKILLTSGYTDKKSQWSVIKEMGFRFIQKPYRINALLQCVRDAIDNE